MLRHVCRVEIAGIIKRYKHATDDLAPSKRLAKRFAGEDYVPNQLVDVAGVGAGTKVLWI